MNDVPVGAFKSVKLVEGVGVAVGVGVGVAVGVGVGVGRTATHIAQSVYAVIIY